MHKQYNTNTNTYIYISDHQGGTIFQQSRDIDLWDRNVKIRVKCGDVSICCTERIMYLYFVWKQEREVLLLFLVTSNHHAYLSRVFGQNYDVFGHELIGEKKTKTIFSFELICTFSTAYCK